VTSIDKALPLRLYQLSAILTILTSATACRGDGAARTAGIPRGPNRACFAPSQSDRWALDGTIAIRLNESSPGLPVGRAEV
jgi:hypothetical protein